MANLLGVPQYDGTLDREARQFTSSLLQNLGQQVRQDLTTIQTQRQLTGLAQGLQNVDPASPDFGKGVISLMSQYPLATKTPIGQAAISQLGAEHKFWQEEQLYDKRRGDLIGMEVLRDAGNNRPYGSPPMTRPEAEAIFRGTGGSTPVTPGVVGATSRDINNGLPLPEADLPTAEVLGPPRPGTAPNIPVAPLDQMGNINAIREQVKAAGMNQKEGELYLRQRINDIPSKQKIVGTLTAADGRLLNRHEDGSVSPVVDESGKQVLARPAARASAQDPIFRRLTTDLSDFEKRYAIKEAEAKRLGTAFVKTPPGDTPEAEAKRQELRVKALALRDELEVTKRQYERKAAELKAYVEPASSPIPGITPTAPAAAAPARVIEYVPGQPLRYK